MSTSLRLKSFLMRDLFRIFFLGVFAALIMSCSAGPGAESTGEFLDSTTTTTKVKASLLDELGTSGFAVKVKTYKDEVQLSGFVNTTRIKQRAGAIAAGVDGVKNVRNDIIVKLR